MAKERPLSLPFPVSRLVLCELVRFGLRHQRSLFPSQPSVLLILSEQARIQTPSCYFFPKQPILGFSLPFFSSFRISPEELVTGIYIHQTQTSSKNLVEIPSSRPQCNHEYGVILHTILSAGKNKDMGYFIRKLYSKALSFHLEVKYLVSSHKNNLRIYIKSLNYP